MRKVTQPELTKRLDGYVDRKYERRTVSPCRGPDPRGIRSSGRPNAPGGGEEARELAESAMQEAAEFLGQPASVAEQARDSPVGMTWGATSVASASPGPVADHCR